MRELSADQGEVEDVTRSGTIDRERPPGGVLGPATTTGRFWFRCPDCSGLGTVDDDQRNGRVSVDCPSCPYHATQDWTAS